MTTNDKEPVLVSGPRPGVRLITLNRPHRLNAITVPLVEGLHAALDRVDHDLDARVIVLTGARRGFCAGFDLKDGWDGAGTDSAEERYRGQQRLASLVTRLREAPVPVVAAVNGPAAGGGFGLALAADIRLAATTASFLVANARLGLSAGEMGISYLLPRLVGEGRAAEMMYTGRAVDAAEALGWGLANHVVAPHAVLDATLDLAAQITANAPFGVRLSKEMLRLGSDAPSLEQALVLENRTQVLAGYNHDLTTAIHAFRAGQPSRFG
ncbi:enoyl-CoA hydratase/isomerase family protein [Pseudofrankia sp. BMG5.36]|uniref:enoyl-CoA hydratase/isomerase family protein n=1 Tax=Pseudofrankia sp. BMG5.36 TaxID=1834512 RepID=UPI0012FF9105|nr:enoyl-CoA hydratase/isomerase family protein [Pseudofrankia sp. BMG5.36]